MTEKYTPRRVLGHGLAHLLRNAMIPVITVLGLQLGALLAGAIVTETIFSWPGIGRLTIQAISNRDYYLVQGCILAIRNISLDDLNHLRVWLETRPNVPDGPWFKDFGSFKLCGEGKYPKTFLLSGQVATGEKL